MRALRGPLSGSPSSFPRLSRARSPPLGRCCSPASWAGRDVDADRGGRTLGMGIKDLLRHMAMVATATFLTAGGIMVTADGRTASDGDTADLIGLEKQFSQAIVKGDIEGLERLVSDDWIILRPAGKVNARTAFFGANKSGLL